MTMADSAEVVSEMPIQRKQQKNFKVSTPPPLEAFFQNKSTKIAFLQPSNS